MLIDAHLHMWERRCLPDEAVRRYLGPISKLKEFGLDGILDLKLDEDYPFPDYDVKMNEPISMMDANDVDYAVVLATDFGLINEGRMSNYEYMDWLFQRCSIDDRFIPFIGIDPNRKDAIEMLDNMVSKYDSKGLKVYPATGFYPDDDKYEGFWKRVEEYGLIVTTHAGMALPPLDEKYCHPRYFDKVAERHPEMKIIIAHLGGKFHDEIFPLMDAHENVYTDCSALQGWVADDISMIGKRLDTVTSRYPKRVVFGTDFPLYEDHTNMYRFLDIIRSGKWGNDAIKADLLGNNMARLLGVL